MESRYPLSAILAKSEPIARLYALPGRSGTASESFGQGTRRRTGRRYSWREGAVALSRSTNVGSIV
jgi:hypothetical protein